MTNATPPADYMSAADVARMLGLSKMTVYRMCQAGELAHIRTGHRGKTYRILRVAVEAHTRPVQTPAATAGPGQTEIGL